MVSQIGATALKASPSAADYQIEHCQEGVPSIKPERSL
jgi:hypothetical protein